MDKRMLAIVLLPGFLVWAGASTQESPRSDELTTGIRQFDEGDLEAAVTSLEAAARGLTSDSTRTQDLARAYLYLAMARLGLGDAEAARRAMAQALRVDPALTLDPSLYPPRVLQLYESVRPPSPPAPTPPPAVPPTLGIEHRNVGCFVAGVFPRLDACFSPLAEVAGARLYFRPASAGGWYYVEMKGEGACHEGVLPRPQRSLAGRTVEYYIEAVGRRFATARTPEYSATVVRAPAECQGATVAAATTVTGAISVFPNLPAGFAASSAALAGTLPVVAVVAGGAAAAGVAVAVAGGGESMTSTTTTTIAAIPPPAAPGPAPVPSPSASPSGEPLQVTCTASPREGVRPLTVRFTTSAIGGTGSYDYRWQFGDGGSSAERNPSYTYTSAGTFTARVTVTSGSQTRDCERDITVQAPAPAPTATPPGYFAPGYVRRVTWTSDLDVEGARGQVVMNGIWSTYPGEGLAHGVVDLPGPAYSPYGADARTVRVEALLVDAAGRPGTWRFDLDAAATYALVEPGSIHVVAGEALQVTASSVVFRLRGTPGERLVFTFRAR